MNSFLENMLSEEPTKIYGMRQTVSGKMITISVSDVDPDVLTVCFKRPLERDDVIGDEFVPTVSQTQRNGKQITGLTLSYDTAKVFCKPLRRALKDARRRQRRAWLRSIFVSPIERMVGYQQFLEELRKGS